VLLKGLSLADSESIRFAVVNTFSIAFNLPDHYGELSEILRGGLLDDTLSVEAGSDHIAKS